MYNLTKNNMNILRKTLSVLSLFALTFSLSTSTFAASPFTDLANSKYTTAIEHLYEEGIIEGYQDGTFRPLQEVNRAELLKIIIGEDIENADADDTKNCFPDVKEEWFAPYVCYAKSKGWVDGYPDGYFRPENTINKVEAIKIVINVYNYTEDSETTLPYNDIINNSWYIPFLQAAYERDLLEETGGNFYPGSFMNRGQISEVIYRVLTGKSGIVQSFCSPSTTVTGEIINVNNVTQLNEAIDKTKREGGNLTILLADGTYEIDNSYWIDVDNLTIRSASGNRKNVTIDGGGMDNGTSNIFQLAGDNITIADMTLEGVQNHLIQVHGEMDADNAVLHNLHLIDAYEQIVKVSYDSQNMDTRSDSGVLECSTLEYTAGIGPQYYIGGIDAHNAKDWVVRDNIFRAIRSPEFAADPSGALAEHAIHFWSDSKNTLVENNMIFNSDRGIGFGLGDRGHQGGIIKNNKIYHDGTRCDAGITLENSSGTVVQDNIILQGCDYPNAIEYRFAGSKNIQINGNQTNKTIKGRDGAQATLNGNKQVQITDFKDPSMGDFSYTN